MRQKWLAVVLEIRLKYTEMNGVKSLEPHAKKDDGNQCFWFTSQRRADGEIEE